MATIPGNNFLLHLQCLLVMHCRVRGRWWRMVILMEILHFVQDDRRQFRTTVKSSEDRR